MHGYYCILYIYVDRFTRDSHVGNCILDIIMSPYLLGTHTWEYHIGMFHMRMRYEIKVINVGGFNIDDLEPKHKI